MKKLNKKITMLLVFFGFMLMGSSAYAGTVTKTFKDEFGTQDYDLQYGNSNFSTDWIEDGDTDLGPTNEYIRIDDVTEDLYLYYLWDENIKRSLDLSNASSVELTFDYRTELNGDHLNIQFLDKDGTTWNTRMVIDDSSLTPGSISYTLTADEIHASSAIRFMTDNNWDNNDKVWIDNVLFTATYPTDTDGDGVPDNIDMDDDNDGILDEEEGIPITGTLGDIFKVSGDAALVSSTEVQLTPDDTNKVGTAMSKNRINLHKDISFDFELYFGAKDGNGADGIVFVLHNDPDGTDAKGTDGSGIGAEGIANGIGIEFDTWRNNENSNGSADIDEDHTQIRDTDESYESTAGAITSVTALSPTDVETENWYPVHMEWNATTATLSYSFNGGTTLSYTNQNIENDYFVGTNLVYFGFTSATGGYSNDQRMRQLVINFDTDTDNDGIDDYHDLDSDNDGIPDNIEGQTSVDYIAPGATFVDDNDNGLNDKYESAQGGSDFVFVDKDEDGIPDYLDDDSDNDGDNDCSEGLTTGAKDCNLSTFDVGTNGLVDWGQNGDDYSHVNGIINSIFDDNDLENEGGGTTEVDFRDKDTTLPITVAYVYPQSNGNTVDVEFTTATEVGNIGFNVYAIVSKGKGKKKKWIKLNDELIEGALDSFAPTEYRVSLNAPKNLKFKKIGIAGVDVNGEEDRHGPFKIGHESGEKTAVVPIDWKKVNKEVKADKKVRKAAKKAKRKARRSARKTTKKLLKVETVNLEVKEDGIYRVTHDDLLEAGINLKGINARNIAISLRGEGVARYIDAKGKWTEESWIEFKGEAPQGRNALYLDANKYQLSLSKKKVVESDVLEPMTSKKIIIEKNNKYGNLSQGNDPFYENYFYAKGEKQITLSSQFTLPELGEGQSEITFYMSATSDVNHHVSISLNGTEAVNDTSSGIHELSIEITVDNSTFNEGDNEIVLTATAESEKYDIFLYDKLVISYDDGEPAEAKKVVISLEEKVAKKSLKPARGTNYLIISHPLFMGELLDHYISQREGEGWKIQLVNVEDIYEAYGYGMETPEAIKAYLKVAERKGVTHVQLVGASNYDYRNYLGFASVSLIPSIYTKIGRANFAPSDALYVSDENDMPQMAIGRWPVRTLGGLENVINKSLNWKESGQSSVKKALFIADKESNGFSFGNQLETVAQKFEKTGKWNDITRVFMDKLLDKNGDDLTTSVAEARTTIFNTLDEGPSIVSYNGHSSPSKWSYDGLIKPSDLSSIQNQGKTAMALPLACYSAYADAPSVNTIAHQFLVADESGAVLIYGAALLSSYVSNAVMMEKVIDGLFLEKTIGEAVLDAKTAMGSDYKDAVLNGTLLGDVTLRLR